MRYIYIYGNGLTVDGHRIMSLHSARERRQVKLVDQNVLAVISLAFCLCTVITLIISWLSISTWNE